MVSFTSTTLLTVTLGLGILGSAAAADCTTHTVVSGDTCASIASAAGISVSQLESFNPNADCTDLQLDEKLCVSSGSLPGAPGPSANGTCFEHFVVRNETCASIAAANSITVTQLENFNNNTWKWKGCSPGDLDIGEVICVSSGTPPPIPIDPNQQCGPQTVGNVTCPLNACCSAFGFCGLTDQFCSTTGQNPCQTNCFQPTVPSCPKNTLKRKIGYYQGGAMSRTAGCDPVSPLQLDLTGYTHVHYAFATISTDYELQIAQADVTPLTDLVQRKNAYSGLKVLIAVGGWDFSEDGDTRDLWSLMVGSSANRATFIKSILAFLELMSLDGIDIDFEYPGAIERDAPATDTPDLTAFFSELRTALPSQYLISIATPAGYWFLKGFEIDKIVGNVTYINMMSYDYHGPWDTNVTDQAPVTNPHTSLLDMEASVELYVRAGIDLSIVNLGLAHYGRSYHLVNAGCTGYNCTMVGGGAPGVCTQASGILAQFEIETMMANGNKPNLDDASQTYWFDTSAGDLITFDQNDTLTKKITWAQQSCFGGTFEWSLDLVTPSDLHPVKPSIPPKNCKAAPKVVGYYFGSAASRSCLPWGPNVTDSSTYTHIIYGFASVAADGTVSLTTTQTSEIQQVMSMKDAEPDLKVMLGVGGWGFGADASGFIAAVGAPGTQSTFASTAAALVAELGIDGVDIEWPTCPSGTCVSAANFASLVSATKSSLGTQLLVSVHLPIDFWSLPDYTDGLVTVAGYAEWISLITTYANPAVVGGDDPNSINWIEQSLTLATKSTTLVPSSMFLFGIPFFSRPLGSSKLQSSCLASGDLGQGTYGYYAVNSIINGFNYDTDEWSDYSVDQDNFYNVLALSDGSTMYSDSQWSIPNRVASSIQNCMGGVVVFSLDQDNQASELTNAIYGPGGYIPSVDKIASGLNIGNAIGGNGFVDNGPYDTYSAALAASYPWLTAQDSYRVLLLGALQVQNQVANQLKSYLTAPELSSDNFTLYKTWEGKAVDLQIANMTGWGNQYFTCTEGGSTTIHCPGYINLDDTPANPSPHITKYATVQWTLTDHDGFKALLNSSLGLDLDTLVSGGSFEVSRDDDSCTGSKPPPPCKGCDIVVEGPVATSSTGNVSVSAALSSLTPNATMLSANSSTTSNSSITSRSVLRRDDDPLNVPSDCETTWQGLYLINTETFFKNPVDIINGFVGNTATALSQYQLLALRNGTSTTTLMSLLQATLTSISVGNDTIGSIQSYISQTKLDEQEQAAAEAESRSSAISTFTNIGLMLLSFIPGVGDIVDLAAGGVDIFSAISDVVDIASIAKKYRRRLEHLQVIRRAF
ncbi:Glycoside hydrolase family 18 protein [Mycena sanguinolenta]|uniref:Glycoside hydrolase family 18 protein n=1 Tax=Mycena sanguinolenta TaxID=230812 RepID=A0A8H6YZ61_9AGAR|nr:Glycoside hydrolase family 18 protein [Mycena sanguinolenta]